MRLSSPLDNKKEIDNNTYYRNGKYYGEVDYLTYNVKNDWCHFYEVKSNYTPQTFKKSKRTISQILQSLSKY